MWVLSFEKPLEELTESDLQALVTYKEPEGRQLEYKLELPGSRDVDKREFAGDVSAFANAAGGYIFYGVAENNGIATNIVGLANVDPDKEVRRLEQIIHTWTFPPIRGVLIRPIPLANGAFVIVVRIPRSWEAPHASRVQLGDGLTFRFYVRTSVGKQPLDIQEVRAAFVASETAAERIRSFRVERVAKIIAGETPMPIRQDVPKVVLHVVPSNAFAPGSVMVTTINIQHIGLLPIGSGADRLRYNFDGVLAVCRSLRDEKSWNYAQLFRNGIIEALSVDFITNSDDGRKRIPSGYFEGQLIDALRQYLTVEERLGAQPPVWVMLSILGCGGGVLQTEWILAPVVPFDREDLLFPEARLDDFHVEPDVALRSVFDVLWQAAGWDRCRDYNEQGRWVRKS